MKRLLALLLAGCTTAGSEPVEPSDDAGCTYPEDAATPMAVGEPLAAYRWPKAIHGDGREAPLDLAKFHCENHDDIDFSPFDALLFVSLPAS